MVDSKLLVHTMRDVTIVNFRDSAILDTTSINAVAWELYALIDEKATRRIVLDFARVSFLASQAVGVLITLKKKADAINARVVICGMREELKRVFKIMNLMPLFSFYKTENEALASFDVYTA
ncbi:MAG: STAS domain-containing protein [Planctomycetes bacterium]|nr:STAS domain-containing protein [Planctomycetota bacterium]